MISFFLTWFFSSILFFMMSRFFKDILIPSLNTTLIISLFIGLLNVLIRPVITFFSLPVNLITLGVFSFVVNSTMLKIADAVIGDMTIQGWSSVFLSSFILSIIQISANIAWSERWKDLKR